MDFLESITSSSFKQVHNSDSTCFMTYILSFFERVYFFDFYTNRCKHYFQITCNGKSKYFEIDNEYFNSLTLLSMDSFCIDCVSKLY